LSCYGSVSNPFGRALCVETDDGPPTSGNAVGDLLVPGWRTPIGSEGDPECRAGPGRVVSCRAGRGPEKAAK